MRVGGQARVSDVSEFTVHDNTKDFYLFNITVFPIWHYTVCFICLPLRWLPLFSTSHSEVTLLFCLQYTRLFCLLFTRRKIV